MYTDSITPFHPLLIPQDCPCADHGYDGSTTITELVSNKRYKLACAPIEDSDQPAHPHSLIRVFADRSMGKPCPTCFFFQVENFRLRSDCVYVQTGLNLHCTCLMLDTGPCARQWSYGTSCFDKLNVIILLIVLTCK